MNEKIKIEKEKIKERNKMRIMASILARIIMIAISGFVLSVFNLIPSFHSVFEVLKINDWSYLGYCVIALFFYLVKL